MHPCSCNNPSTLVHVRQNDPDGDCCISRAGLHQPLYGARGAACLSMSRSICNLVTVYELTGSFSLPWKAGRFFFWQDILEWGTGRGCFLPVLPEELQTSQSKKEVFVEHWRTLLSILIVGGRGHSNQRRSRFFVPEASHDCCDCVLVSRNPWSFRPQEALNMSLFSYKCRWEMRSHRTETLSVSQNNSPVAAGLGLICGLRWLHRMSSPLTCSFEWMQIVVLHFDALLLLNVRNHSASNKSQCSWSPVSVSCLW